MVKDQLYILCFSHWDFNEYMRENQLYQEPAPDMAVISICSVNDEDPVHWFPDDCCDRVLNIDFDDVDPSKYWNHSQYDDLLEKYMDGKQTYKDFMFNVDDCPSGVIKAMDYADAERTALFIENNKCCGIRKFFIHCSAGVSRSQGVVRYMMDTYGQIFNIITRSDNPCITPNMHVVRMLKRADRCILVNKYKN